LGIWTVEESAVANVVIEGDTPDIDDLKKEIKLRFKMSSKPWTHFGLQYHIIITDHECGDELLDYGVCSTSRYYDTSLHGTRYNAPERVTKFLPSN
jgi:hypothetical protein